MNRDRILGLIRQPETIDSQNDMALVKELIDAFPFYAAPHALMARLMYDEKSIYFDKHLRLGAAYIGNRELLYDLLHGKQANVAVLVEEETDAEVQKEKESGEIAKQKEGGEREKTAGQSQKEEDKTGRKEHEIAPQVETKKEPEIAEHKPVEVEPVQPNEGPLPTTESAKPKETTPAAPEEKKAPVLEIPSFASYDYFAYYDKVLKKADEETGRPTLDLTVLHEEKKEKAQPVSIPDYPLPDKKEEASNADSMSFGDWLNRLKTPGKTEESKAAAQPKPATPAAEKPDKNVKSSYKTAAVEDIIANFIAQEPRIKPKPSKFYSPEDMARQSAEQDASLATETLAEIYLQQGLTEKAIEIYRELSARFPLKSSYFAAKIKEVKPQ